jgi:hypothetical protein
LPCRSEGYSAETDSMARQRVRSCTDGSFVGERRSGIKVSRSPLANVLPPIQSFRILWLSVLPQGGVESFSPGRLVRRSGAHGGVLAERGITSTVPLSTLKLFNGSLLVSIFLVEQSASCMATILNRLQDQISGADSTHIQPHWKHLYSKAVLTQSNN